MIRRILKKPLFLAYAGAAVAAASLALSIILPIGKSRLITVFIPRGSSGFKVYKILNKNEIIHSELLFKISLKLNNSIYGPVKPGYYDINTQASYLAIGRILCRGILSRLTIPEGFTQKEIAALIEKKLGLNKSAYLQMLKKKIPDYEGKLFPATYRLTTCKPEKIIDEMLRTFARNTEKIKPEWQDIILASIIQKEGARVNEFKRISGVFHNRLNSDMLLEADPTLQYIVGKIRLTREILKNKSPYNTYLYYGLTPGPICNPGIKAIEAAMFPEKHDFYYFVSKKDGTHYFSKTIAEHFKAVGFYQLGYKNGFIPQY